MLKFFEMAPPRPIRNKSASQPAPYRANPPRPSAGATEVVDPVWLLKAVAALVAVALLCGYASLCYLLYQGQWQLILHPVRSSALPASIAGNPFTLVRFGPDGSAIPQLTSWAIPAAAGARYSGLTILFLPAGDGSLIDFLPTLQALHAIGINIFAVDYRGYGQSAAIHPDPARMMHDAETSLAYLTTSRAVPEGQIIVYGVGLGASLATLLAAARPAIPAIILDSPAPDPLGTILRDPRTRFLPVNLLVHDRFPLKEPLSVLKTPKLLLAPDASEPAFTSASAPRMRVDLPAPRSTGLYTLSITRFLDQYLAPRGVQQLQLSHP